MTRRFLLCAAGAIVPAFSVSADFINGGFKSGDFTGWTIGFTPNGATAVQVVEPFDIDGPGPLGMSNAGKFSVGNAASPNLPFEGVELTQSLSLTAGTQYTIDFDWAAIRTITSSNGEGGRFALIVDGVELTFQSAGSTSSTNPHYGHISALYTPLVSGNFSIGVRITRQFTIPTPAAPTLFQYVDNFSIIPAPASLALLGLAGLAGLRRRR